MKKILINILIIVLLIAILGGIGFVAYGFYKKQTMEVKNPIATMEVENFGTIKMELYPDQAPNTVANFIKLAERGFYNNTTFHRVVKDFMIQGGDKNGDGTGNATLNDLRDNGGEDEYTIKGEFLSNKVDNLIKFEEGVLAMARSDYSQYSSDLLDESYNSGSSQFFIMTAEKKSLNGYYTGFGKVIEGLDVVHKIENIEVKAADEGSESESSSSEVSTPVNPPVIKSITVDTFGIDYGEPETLTKFDYQKWLYKQYGLE